MMRSRFAAAALGSIVCVLGTPADAFAEKFTRVSVTTSGRNGPGASGMPSVSADGRYVVFSTKARLTRGDTNDKPDVLLHDKTARTTIRLSDANGGDQPVISADGRFVAYRTIEAIPKILLVSLRTDEPLEMISYPISGAGQSLRGGAFPAVNRDGQFIAYARGPRNDDPDRTSALVVRNRALAPANTSQIAIEDLNDLGPVAISGDGRYTVFLTSDGLVGGDTNGERDVYRFDRQLNQTRWMSSTAALTAGSGKATGLAASGDGTTLAFLSTAQLVPGDTNDRADLYLRPLTNHTAAPQLVPLPSNVIPSELVQGGISVDGQFVAFTGEDGLVRVTDTIGGTTKTIAPGNQAALTGEGARVVFSSPVSNLVAGDTNSSADIFLSRVAGVTINTPPVATLSGVTDGTIILTGSSTQPLEANATDSDGTVFSTSLRLDQEDLQTSLGTSTAIGGLALPKGIYFLSASALDNAFAEGASERVKVIFAPPFGITAAQELTTTGKSDGTTNLRATLRLDNRTGAPSGALRVLLIESPAPAVYDIFGDENLLPARDERVLSVVPLTDPPSLGGFIQMPVQGLVSAPETVGNGFQGIGWIVSAVLQRENAGVWERIDELEIFKQQPDLNDDTPGPNAGIPPLGPSLGDPNFAGVTVTGLKITGRKKVPELGRAQFTAVAQTTAGDIPCQPKWKVDGAPVASINGSGVLSAGSVGAATAVTVRATFAGFSATKAVEILDVPPVVQIKPARKKIDENGGAIGLDVFRTGDMGATLSVEYAVEGSAANGVDFTSLSGTTTIPAGKAGVKLNVTAINDGSFEGIETVSITLASSEAYNLGGSKKATVSILDDDAAPAGQPDAVIQSNKGGTAGVLILNEFNDDLSAQSLFAKAGVNKTKSFNAQFVNRGPTTTNLSVAGSGDFSGFGVRYFDGAAEVTGAVVGGSFAFSNVPSGETRTLRVEITPSAEAPIGGRKETNITVTSSTFLNDTVQAVVERSR